jgi:hypothetical protein
MKIVDATPKGLLVVLMSMTALCLLPVSASAQICAGSNLRYLVRDQRGKAIDPTGLYETKSVNEIDELKDAQKVFKGISGNSVRVIRVSGMCNFREPVGLIVKHQGKAMKLTFLMPKFTEYESRSFLVDSIPFRSGTFEINLAGASIESPLGYRFGTLFPARGWKQVKAGKH